MKRTVLIYAKPPVMGLSKTRLARDLGRSEAARIARFTMAQTLRAVLAGPWQARLYTTPTRACLESLGGLWPNHLPRCDQGKGDLTDRLNKGLEEAPLGQILFIGADAPNIRRRDIALAFETLKRHHCVFGPARDGGFWLFGLTKTPRTPSPFSAVRWSSPHAAADVAANLPAGASVGYLPEYIDIDTGADWRDWRHQHA